MLEGMCAMSNEGTQTPPPSIDISKVDVSKIPYPAGSKSFQVAQRIIAGDTDNRAMSEQIKITRKTIVNIRGLLKKMGLVGGEGVVKEKPPPKGHAGQAGTAETVAPPPPPPATQNTPPRDTNTTSTGSDNPPPPASPDRTQPLQGQKQPADGNGEGFERGQERLVPPRARIVRETREDGDDSKIVGEMVAREMQMAASPRR